MMERQQMHRHVPLYTFAASVERQFYMRPQTIFQEKKSVLLHNADTLTEEQQQRDPAEDKKRRHEFESSGPAPTPSHTNRELHGPGLS
jgi:hypothetical protein